MKTFRKHLSKKLKDKNFKEAYEEEKMLLELSRTILELRNKSGLSQKELADKAHITQQQLSKIENGLNCNIMTFLKVCYALGIKLNLGQVA